MFQSRPRYGPISDKVLKIVCFERARYERAHSYLRLVAVDLEGEVEGVEDLATQFGVCVGELVV